MSKLKIKDLNTVANVYEIPTVGTGATITGSLEGDVIVIDSNSTKFTVKASSSKLTITGINDFGKKFSVTVTFDKSKAAVAQTAKIVFADGAVDFAYNPATKILSSNGTPVGKSAVGVSTLSVDSAINADSFNGANDGTPAPVLGKTFTLTTGVDNIAGTAGNDTIDARTVMGQPTLDEFDVIDGGAGRDSLINVGKAGVGEFVGVSNIEIISAAGFINLGADAADAGIDTLNMSRAAATAANITGFDAALTVNGSAQNDTVRLDLADAGDKTLVLAGGANTVNVKGVVGAAAGSVVMSFESAAVGNGTGTVKIDGVNGDITAGNTGTVFVGDQANQFSVIGTDAAGTLIPAQDRGDFQTVVLGTAGADTASTADAGNLGNVYINAGAGDDILTANAAAAARHFLVGGAGNDMLNVTTTATGTVVAISGGGNDTVNVAAGSTGSETITLVSGTNTVNYAGAGLTLNTPVAGANRDTLTGGSDRDTLAATSAVLTAVGPAAVAADQSISGFEALTVTDAQNATTLVTTNIQAGIDTVSLNGTSVAASSVTFGTGVAATVNLGAVAAGAITVASAGTGVSDQVTIANTAPAVMVGNPAVLTAVNAFGGQSITANGVETLVINTNAAGAPTAQTANMITVNGTVAGNPAAATPSTVNIAGSNSFVAAMINAETVNASGLTGTTGLVATTGTRAVNVTGSSGNDALTVNATTAAEVAQVSQTVGGVTTIITPGVAAVNAVVSTGAGNDGVTMATTGTGATTVTTGDGVDGVTLNSRSTGKLTVDMGAGNDGLNLGAGGILVGDSITGGDGTDTVSVTGVATRQNGDYVVINERLLSFEQLVFNGAETGLNANLLQGRYTALQFTDNSSVIGVSTQRLGTQDNLEATALGYTVGAANVGTLNITSGDVIGSASPAFVFNASAANQVTANAQTLNLSVLANSANAVNTTVAGDLTTLNVTLTNGATTATPPVPTLASVAVTTTDGGSLDELTSLTLSGNGSATVVNGAATGLVTVNAAAMTAGIAGLDGLTYTTTNASAETITLGGGADTVTFNAGGSNVVLGAGGVITSFDTVNGLSLVLDANNPLVLGATSDDIAVGGVVGGAKFVVAAGVTTLENAVQSAAQAAGKSLVFQFQGDTYAFVDNGNTANLDTGDTLVKLTGLVDLDALLIAIA